MDVQQDLLSYWSFPDDPCSVLEDFDQTPFIASPTDCQPEAACPGLESKGAAHLQTCSEGNTVLNISEDIPAYESGRKASKAQGHAKESNRRAQQRHRAKIKSKWERLEQELSVGKATVTKLQAENRRLHSQHSKHMLLERAAMLQSTESTAVTVPAQVVTRPSLLNSIPYVRWSTDAVTCTVNQTDQTLTGFQVARMAQQQIAILWQDYVRELAICIALLPASSSPLYDLASTQGQRLSQLHNEAISLNVVLARSSRDKYRAFNTSPIGPQTSAQGTLGRREPDWLELGHSLKLSEGQLSNIFLLRQAFLQKQAGMESHQQELEQQLAQTPFDPFESGTVHAAAATQLAQQLQEITWQLHEARIQYQAVIFDGVSHESIDSRVSLVYRLAH